MQYARKWVGKCRIPGAGASPRPRSPAPLSQLSQTSGLRTLVHTAQTAETRHARQNTYLQRIIFAAPFFPAPSEPLAGCSPQISVTAKSARPSGSAPRHRPLTNPERGSWLQDVSLGFYEAFSQKRKLPLPLPAAEFPPAARERKVGRNQLTRRAQKWRLALVSATFRGVARG